MKRFICSAFAALLAVCLLFTTVAAEFDVASLIVKDAYAASVRITALDAEGKAISADAEEVYAGVMKLTVQYSGAVEGKEYVLFLQKEDADPSEANILYMDQQTATDAGVTFTAFPGAMPKTTCYISISGNGSTGITQKTVVASFVISSASLPGDVNNDGYVNPKDINVLRRAIAGGYGVTVDEAVADVNHDGAMNAKNVTHLRRAIAGGYGITLE